MTDMAMDRGMEMEIRPRLWNPKADVRFCNAADGVECRLEVEGDWRSERVRVRWAERVVAAMSKCGAKKDGDEVCAVRVGKKRGSELILTSSGRLRFSSRRSSI